MPRKQIFTTPFSGKEENMIGPMDEYLIHQTAAPIAKVASDDPNWQDRFYFNFIDPSREVAGLLGMGVFPNRNVFQGVLNIIADGKLICKNYFRQLENDRHEIRADSLRIDVCEPLKKWNLKLEEKELGVALDLSFDGRTVPFEFERITFERDGDIHWDQCHYTQAGEYNGTLCVGDHSVSRLVGVRDRSWGIRDMFNLDFWIWISANFDDFWLTAWLGETATGDLITVDGAICTDDGLKDQITALSYDIDFVREMRTPASSRYSIETASGRKVGLSAAALQTIYVSIHDGIYDLSNRDVLAERDRDTIIFDQLQEFHLDGKPGLGIIEFFVMGGCHNYSKIWRSMR